MAASSSARAASVAVRRSHSNPAPSCSSTLLPPPSTINSSPHHPPLPSFIKPRLAQLRKGIIEQLAGRDRIPAFLRLREASAEANSPTMETMARLYFDRGGKLLRPTIALLMASACNQEVAIRRGISLPDDVSANQARIALIAEMIHVASLVHDDVIDEAATRRGAPSVSGLWGNKMAVLAGDFILARATQCLCVIGDPLVISTMATIIEDLVVGEFLQMSPSLSPAEHPSTFNSLSHIEGEYSDRLSLYLAKSERKTASLFANSCRSVALLADKSDSSLHEAATSYGRHVGLAFQLVDDAMDYELGEEEEGICHKGLGKPTGVDLEQGLITGPLLLAARNENELMELLGEGEGRRKRTAAEIRQIVRDGRGCERTRKLAAEHAERAAAIACEMRTENGTREALAALALRQLSRKA